MNKKELKELAIKELNTRRVQSIRTRLCNSMPDKKQKKECKIAFDKSFVKSFIGVRTELLK